MVSEHEDKVSREIVTMFADCHTWLEQQPGMDPLEPGRDRLIAQLEQWLRVYSGSICTRVVNNGDEHHDKYVQRMWRCWSHHWQQAMAGTPGNRINGLEVAERIRAGRGYLRGGRLGGDPLRDVVLAVAMTVKDGHAPDCFKSDYYEFSQQLAGKVHARFRYDPDDWWNEFLDLLAGYTRSPAKLDSFHGKCALRNWLGTVLWNFLRRRTLPQGVDPEHLSPAGSSSSDQVEDVSQAECRELFVRLVARAIDQLSKQDALVLKLLYVPTPPPEPAVLPIKEVARILGVAPGTACRRRDRAIDRLRAQIATQITRAAQEQAFEDCRQWIVEGKGGFADALCAALEAHFPEGTES